MTDTPFWFYLGLTALLAGALGWFLARLRASRRIAELETTLDLERRGTQEKLGALDKNFATLSQQALKENSQSFLQLANESLKQFHALANADLTQKEKAIENLVKPLAEALAKTEQQVRQMEKERQEAYGSLTRHLQSMAETQQQLQGETRNLVQALRRPEVRGQWGELALKRLAELAGMVEHSDFHEQVQIDTEEGRMRPDMVVRLPGGREIVVDAKTPLDAYLSAIEAPDLETRKKFLEQHARKVRERVKELAAKAYWDQFQNAPDFVVLFIPGEQFLGAALDVDRGLFEDALRQKIILATPANFVALLRTVAYGWRQEALAENAQEIRSVGEELYARLSVFSEHLTKLGKSLGMAVGDYNKAIGSYETKLLPGARKFVDMGVGGNRTLEPPEQVDKALRDIQQG